jgi:hypothetical protein
MTAHEMSTTTQKLLVEILGLPQKARAQLAERLLASLEEDEASPQVAAAWKEVALRRWQNLKTGKTEWRDAKDAIQAARTRLKRCV